MRSTQVQRTVTTAIGVLLLAASMAASMTACGGGDSSGSAASSSATSSAASTEPTDPGPVGTSESEIGKTFCDAIRAVQADLPPDAPSAAYLAQVTIKLDPVTTAQLSATVVDRATEKECPDEYQQFLEQAGIASLVELGLQP